MLRQDHLQEPVLRLARTAGIGAWEQLSPHSLRHSAITFTPELRRFAGSAALLGAWAG
jgi:hypothetical protein